MNWILGILGVLAGIYLLIGVVAGLYVQSQTDDAFMWNIIIMWPRMFFGGIG